MKRAHVPLKVKLAATLLQMKRMDANGQLVRVISHEEAKSLTADQIISRFQFDHFPIPHAEGGPDLPWNIDPSPTPEHRVKTAKVDVPQIAKSKRVRDNEAEHNKAMAWKTGMRAAAAEARRPKRGPSWPSRPIPSRPFSKMKRKVRR